MNPLAALQSFVPFAGPMWAPRREAGEAAESTTTLAVVDGPTEDDALALGRLNQAAAAYFALQVPSSWNIPNTQFISSTFAVQSRGDIWAARSVVINDGYGFRIVRLLSDAVLGAGGIYVDFGDERVNTVWEHWAWDKTNQYKRPVDLQHRIFERVIVSGESFGIFRDGYYVEVDPLDLPVYNVGLLPMTGWINSIYYDDEGVPRQYSVLPRAQLGVPPYTVQASDMIHVFRDDHEYQKRGISWLRAALAPIRELDSLEKLASMLLETFLTNPGIFEVEQGVLTLATVDQATDARLKEMLRADPRQKSIAPEGVKWQGFALPSALSGTILEEVVKRKIAKIGRALSLSYQTIAGLYDNGSYSSARMAVMEDRQVIEHSQLLMIQAMRNVADKWLGYMERMVPNFPRGLMPEFYPPAETHAIDPQKRANADKADLQSMLTSRSHLIRSRGGRPERVFQEILRERELLGIPKDELTDGDTYVEVVQG